MIGDLISAAAGMFSQHQANQTAKKQMTHGIRMRVNDAQAAGIHPLAALGANIQPVGSQPVLGDAALAGLREAGNKLAPATEAERLANEETRSRIRVNEAQAMETSARSRTIAMGARQPMGSTVGTVRVRPSRINPYGSTGQNLGYGGGGLWRVDPQVADAESVQTRYGDVAENVHGLGIALPRDLWHNRSLLIPPRRRSIGKGSVEAAPMTILEWLLDQGGLR